LRIFQTEPGQIFKRNRKEMGRIHEILGSNIPLIPLGICLALSLGTFQLWRTWYRLRHIPGPFPACITNFQRVLWVKTKRAHLILQDVHEKYGEVVRIGPNMVTFSNPEAIPTVYTTRTGFPKVSQA
jgi:hypothetical protein